MKENVCEEHFWVELAVLALRKPGMHIGSTRARYLELLNKHQIRRSESRIKGDLYDALFEVER